MRPGLVVVGGLFVVLAAAALLEFNLVPNTTDRQDRGTLLPQAFAPNSTGVALLPGSDTTDGTLVIAWNATHPLNLWLFSAPGCSRPTTACVTGPPLASWTGRLSGSWQTSGTLTFPYLVSWANPGATNGTVSATTLETTHRTVAPSFLDRLLVDGAAAALGGVGGVAVFLGLFLRGGVYRGPPPIAFRSAEDLADLVPPGRPK